jgi:hypothetical protein
VATESEGSRFFVRRNRKQVRHSHSAGAYVHRGQRCSLRSRLRSRIFAITREPLVASRRMCSPASRTARNVFSASRCFASFHLLRYGLALILIFVGLKMSGSTRLGKAFPTPISLGVIKLDFTASIGLSLVFPTSARRKTR